MIGFWNKRQTPVWSLSESLAPETSSIFNFVRSSSIMMAGKGGKLKKNLYTFAPLELLTLPWLQSTPVQENQFMLVAMNNMD